MPSVLPHTDQHHLGQQYDLGRQDGHGDQDGQGDHCVRDVRRQ